MKKGGKRMLGNGRPRSTRDNPPELTVIAPHVPSESRDPQILEVPPESSVARKKEEPKKDPRNVAPSSLTKQTFLLKFPFVQVYSDMTYMGKEDKCGRNYMMDYDTIQAFVEYLGPALDDLYASFTTEGGELKTKPIHCGFLHEIRKLVDACMYQKNKENDTSEMEGLKIEILGELPEVEEDSAPTDPRDSTSSKEGMDLSHESVSASGFADFILRAYDKAYIKRCKLHRCDESALCTFMIVEPKGTNIEKVWKNGPGGVFQAADYSMDEASANLQKGKKIPIHLQSWSKDHWTYGVLVVDGVVELLEDGEVVGRPELQADFEDRELRLKRYLNDKNATYDAKEYLVAKLYVSNEILRFPHKEMCSKDSYRFFETILRICLGEKVLKWSAKDAAELFLAVEEAKRKKKDEINKDAVGRARYEAFRPTKRLRL